MAFIQKSSLIAKLFRLFQLTIQEMIRGRHRMQKSLGEELTRGMMPDRRNGMTNSFRRRLSHVLASSTINHGG